MADHAFTVTLPSNSNMQAHPSNRGSKYTVKLATPINFAGQTLNDDSNWEVALASMQYTNRFYEIREVTVIHVVVEIPDVWTLTLSVPAVKGVRHYSHTISSANLASLGLPAAEKRIVRLFVKEPGTTTPSFIVYGTIVCKIGNYNSPAEIVNIITETFAKMFGPRYNTSLTATINGESGMIGFDIEPNTNKVYLFTEKPAMVNTLGMTGKAIDAETPTIYQLSLTSTKTPRFDTVQSLYVYSDIVKHQHVGDTLAPLLEIAPVLGVVGQRIHHSWQQLTYLPVNRTYIESISIEIYDEYGNPIVFSDDVENVICRLRFRRAKHSALAALL